MKGLKEAIEEVISELDEKDTVREIAIKASREIRRRAKNAIFGMHRGQDVLEELRALRQEQMALISTLKEYPELSHAGYVSEALQELTEALVLYSIINDSEIPTPRELKIDASSYVLGLSDVIGELRRSAVDSMKSGDEEKASLRLVRMEEVYEAIIGLEYPSAIVNIRQKQDIARALIEKTRGEISLSKRLLAVERKME